MKLLNTFAEPLVALTQEWCERLQKTGRIRAYGESYMLTPFSKEGPLLVSACLTGLACRYDGKSCPHPQVCALQNILPVCPECLGGLSTPRTACEIQGQRVVSREKEDKTRAFMIGAEEAFLQGLEAGAHIAILKTRSPSCGLGQVYDGTFSKRLRSGDGIFVALLKRAGFILYTEENFPFLKSGLL